MLRTIASAVVLVLTATTPLRAQSALVEASKRAEEASKANKVYTPSFSNANLSSNLATAQEAVFTELTMPQLRKWAKTIRGVKEAYQDKALLERMQNTVAWSLSISAIERAFIREPALMKVITANELTPREYIVTNLAFVLALAATQNANVESAFAGLGYVIPNAQLLRANKTEVDAMVKDVDQVLAQQPTK